MGNELTITEILVARRSLQEMARRERRSLDKILNEINETIAEARANTDPKVRAAWALAPFGDRTPTPEEFIAWCARMAREREEGCAKS